MKLLLDEHVALAVARNLSAPGVEAMALRDWHAGAYLQVADDVILQAAHAEGWILVTYDRRTIPHLLKTWGEQGIAHGGVVFVDERTIAQNDVGGLIRALAQLVNRLGDAEWESREVYLTR